MATHLSILPWAIPQTEEPGGLQSMGLQRVRHDLVTKQQVLLERGADGPAWCKVATNLQLVKNTKSAKRDEGKHDK